MRGSFILLAAFGLTAACSETMPGSRHGYVDAAGGPLLSGDVGGDAESRRGDNGAVAATARSTARGDGPARPGSSAAGRREAAFGGVRAGGATSGGATPGATSRTGRAASNPTASGTQGGSGDTVGRERRRRSLDTTTDRNVAEIGDLPEDRTLVEPGDLPDTGCGGAADCGTTISGSVATESLQQRRAGGAIERTFGSGLQDRLQDGGIRDRIGGGGVRSLMDGPRGGMNPFGR